MAHIVHDKTIIASNNVKLELIRRAAHALGREVEIVDLPERELFEHLMRHRPSLFLGTGFSDNLAERDANVRYLAEMADLPTICIAHSPTVATLFGRKDLTKVWLDANGVPTAAWQPLGRETVFPCMVKAPGFVGGEGVAYALSLAAVRDPYRDHPGTYVEPFLQGAEYSLNAIMTETSCLVFPLSYKGSTSRDGRHPLERVRCIPAPGSATLTPLALAPIYCLMSRLSRHLRGALDIDFIASEGQLLVSEINARPSGMSFLLEAGTGLNLYQELMLAVADAPAGIRHAPPRGYALEIPLSTLPTDPISDALVYPRAYRFSAGRIIFHRPTLQEAVDCVASLAEYMDDTIVAETKAIIEAWREEERS